MALFYYLFYVVKKFEFLNGGVPDYDSVSCMVNIVSKKRNWGVMFFEGVGTYLHAVTA